MSQQRQIVNTNGMVLTGIFDYEIDRVNPEDYEYLSPMGKPVTKLRKHFAFNHFQYFGCISPDLVFGCAMANTRVAAVMFCYIYQPATKQLREWNFIAPLGLGLKDSPEPNTGLTVFKKKNVEIRYDNNAKDLRKTLFVEIGTELKIQAEFVENENKFEPMRICTRAGANGWVYARKVAGVRAHGAVQCEFGSFDLDKINAYAHHDWTAGFMRRETVWNWACLSGEANGLQVGLNLSNGVNETGYTENCFWLNGALYKVDTVDFEFSKKNWQKTWKIRSFDGQVDLKFEPEGFHEEKQNFGLVASNFKQFFGRFNGTIKPPGKEVIAIDDLYGFTEDQYAKW